MEKKNYKEILAHIDNFLFDVDGVFTDNRVILVPDHPPLRTLFTRDAYAVQLAVKEGLRIIVISGGNSRPVVESFMRLGVTEVHMQTADKLKAFEQLVSEGLDPARTAYMGDDIPDLRVMERVALPCAPQDAAEEVKNIAAYISRFPGGGGCVRDLLQQAMKVQGKWLNDGSHTW